MKLEEKKREKELKEKKKLDCQKNEKKNLKKKGCLKRKIIFDNKSSNGKKSKKPKQSKKQTETDESSDESDVPLKELCDDDELDDVELGLSLADQNNDVCFYCEEGGRDNELWYRCVLCGFWAHADCSGWDSPEDYECDRCAKKKREQEKKNKDNKKKP